MFGLSEENIAEIRNILSQFVEIEQAMIFGSRAKGNFKKTSDIDIVLKGNKITHNVVLSLSIKLNEESLMPYHFDVINYNTIENKALLDHINQFGLQFHSQ
jgi:predicted nucleotidyltransferase